MGEPPWESPSRDPSRARPTPRVTPARALTSRPRRMESPCGPTRPRGPPPGPPRSSRWSLTDMTLNSDSMLWHFLDKNYPYGAFNTRKNTLKVFVDKMNGNKFFNKFWVEINLFKDGEKTVDLMMDTRTK